MKKHVLISIFIFTLLASATVAEAFVPTEEYTTRNICGWNVLISPDLAAQPELDRKAMGMLELQLAQIEIVVPPEAVERLKTVKIWIQADEKSPAGACFHPSEQWLREHGVNPDKAGAVDIQNARGMLTEYDRQPMLVLHELAHAYHFHFLPDGFDNADVQRARTAALEAGRYKSVLSYWQQTEPAYASTNPQEYFAELTECYFGENDFYPFVKTEFREYDPDGFAMIEALWGVK